MRVTDDTIDIARNCRVADLYIGIPHQRPPALWDATKFPPDPEADDAYVLGDHDWHACLPILNALTWKGHQWGEVQALAEKTIREIEGGE